MSEYIKNLGEAIAAMHECRCVHFGTEHVREEHDGRPVWEGYVEIFQLEGHPETNVAYGWAWDAGDGTIDYIGILGKPPVISAVTSVRAAIASGNFLPIDKGKVLLDSKTRNRAEKLKPTLIQALEEFRDRANFRHITKYEVLYKDMIPYCPLYDDADFVVVDVNEVQRAADDVGVVLSRGDDKPRPSFIFTDMPKHD